MEVIVVHAIVVQIIDGGKKRHRNDQSDESRSKFPAGMDVEAFLDKLHNKQ